MELVKGKIQVRIPISRPFSISLVYLCTRAASSLAYRCIMSGTGWQLSAMCINIQYSGPQTFHLRSRARLCNLSIGALALDVKLLVLSKPFGKLMQSGSSGVAGVIDRCGGCTYAPVNLAFVSLAVIRQRCAPDHCSRELVVPTGHSHPWLPFDRADAAPRSGRVR